MKIGILTLPLHINYGGILQAYALQKVLENSGHDSIIVRLAHNNPSPCLKEFIKRFIKFLLQKGDGVILRELRYKKEKKIIEKYIEEFIKNELKTTTVSYTSTTISDINNQNFDAFVVGGDQVWRPKYARSFLYSFFLDFIDEISSGVRRIAYSVSFGTDEIEYSNKEQKICRNLIKKFDAISVREESGLTLLKKYAWVGKTDAQQAIDPTLLLEKEDYDKIIINENGYEKDVEKGNLVYYFLDLDKDKIRVFEIIEKKLGLKKTNIGIPKTNYNIPLEKRIIPPISLWLLQMKNAKFVVTDSFHGCVFCIIFNKPFIVLKNLNRGVNRIQSFLELYHLEYRIIQDESSEDEINNIIKTTINWKKVNLIKENKRKESMWFLENTLKK